MSCFPAVKFCQFCHLPSCNLKPTCRMLVGMALVPFSSGRRSTRESSVLDGVFDGVSLLERLDEFRRRLVYSALAVAVGVLVCFAFINQIVNFLLAPTRKSLPPGATLIYTQPGEA